MKKEELLARLNDIEWNDFEVKEASGGIPKSVFYLCRAIRVLSDYSVTRNYLKTQDTESTRY